MKSSIELQIIIFLMLLSFVFLFWGMDTQIVGEQLCVDGSNNINLEGIMCEKSETTWFGLDSWFMFLSLIPFCLFVLWSILFNKSYEGGI